MQAQKRIEENIRMERVYENMEHAMEYSVRPVDSSLSCINQIAEKSWCTADV